MYEKRFFKNTAKPAHCLCQTIHTAILVPYKQKARGFSAARFLLIVN